MSNNWSFLGDAADWYDHQTNRIIEARDNMFRWADPRGLSGHTSILSPIGFWAAWGNGLVHMSQGIVDTLRIGNGIRQGGWGYAEDAMRAMNLFDGAGRVIGRVGRVMRVVFQSPGTVTCVWNSFFNALERTGNGAFFVNLRDLMTSVGTSESAIITAGGTTPAMFRQLVSHLRNLRMELEELHVGIGQLGWESLQNFAAIRRRGVFLITIRYARQGANAVRSVASDVHTIIATSSREYGLIFQDTNGRIYAGLSALHQAYPEATISREFAMVFIRDSAMVTVGTMRSATSQAARVAEASGGEGSLLENIVVPVVSVISRVTGRE